MMLTRFKNEAGNCHKAAHGCWASWNCAVGVMKQVHFDKLVRQVQELNMVTKNSLDVERSIVQPMVNETKEQA